MNYTRKEQIANGAPIPPLTESERLTKALAGAGGSGLPDYSNANSGDVLTVQTKYDVVKTEHVVVPEQTVTLTTVNNYIELENFDASIFFDADCTLDPPVVITGDKASWSINLVGVPVIINGVEHLMSGYFGDGEFLLQWPADPDEQGVHYTLDGVANSRNMSGYFQVTSSDAADIPGDYTVSCVVTSTVETPTEKLEPKWSAPSAGGGGVMFVNITSDEVEGQTVYSADKTFAEIAAAVEAGQDVVARMLYDSNDFEQYSMFEYLNAPDEKYVSWGAVYLRRETTPSGTAIHYDLVKIQSDGVADTVEVTTTDAWVAD